MSGHVKAGPTLGFPYCLATCNTHRLSQWTGLCNSSILLTAVLSWQGCVTVFGVVCNGFHYLAHSVFTVHHFS